MARRHYFTHEQILAAMEASAGILMNAAQRLREASGRPCSRNYIANRIMRSAKLAEAIQEIYDRHLDLAEGQLMNAVARGESWAVVFLLRTKGKSRGWTEKLEVGGQVVHTHRRGTGFDPNTATSEELDDYIAQIGRGPAN